MKGKTLTMGFGLFLFYVFALIGMITASVVLHEYSHKIDYKEISKDGEIALFVIPDNMSFKTFFSEQALAQYTYSYYMEDKEEESRISKYTEWKAYGVTITIVLIFLISQLIVLKRWILGKDE